MSEHPLYDHYLTNQKLSQVEFERYLLFAFRNPKDGLSCFLYSEIIIHVEHAVLGSTTGQQLSNQPVQC